MGFAVSIIEFLVATRDQKKAAVWRGMWRELKFATRCLTTSRRLRSDIPRLSRSRSGNRLISSVPNNLSAINNSPNSSGCAENVHHQSNHTKTINNSGANNHTNRTNLRMEQDTSRDHLLMSEARPSAYEQQHHSIPLGQQHGTYRSDQRNTGLQCPSSFDQSDIQQWSQPQNNHSYQQMQNIPYSRNENEVKRLTMPSSIVRANIGIGTTNMNGDSELWQISQGK
ncbi:unnamed protein product [Heterobilharzia americana]|nr:unnamed protein product [Heterobilharzia americana]